jgi:drug/metabolite transporter (DMT)-like permease
LARLSGAEALAIAFWRVLIAWGVIGTLLLAQGGWREWRGLSRRDLLLALAAGTFLAVHFWSWIASLSHTTVAASVLLVNLHPVVIVAGSALWLKERPSGPQVVGIVVALAGAGLIALDARADDAVADGITRSVGEGSRAAGAVFGNSLALLGAVTVGLYYLVGRSLRQRLSLLPYVGLVYGACLLVLLAFASVQGAHLAPQPAREWVLFAAIAIGPMLVGHTGFNWSLRYVPAFLVSLLLLLEPVGASLLAWMLPAIQETPGVWTLGGGLVLLAGLAWTASRPAASPG